MHSLIRIAQAHGNHAYLDGTTVILVVEWWHPATRTHGEDHVLIRDLRHLMQELGY